MSVWLDFLLNPSLLEKHLLEKNDPSPVELIVNFLSQISTNGENKNDIFFQKKVSSLKLLAIKVSAYIKWDINLFEEELPITIQFMLFKEFLKIVDACNNTPQECNIFAYLIHFRWLLRSIVKLSYPIRGPRGLSLPSSFLQQIDYVPLESLESLFEKLREISPTAVNYLEKLVQGYKAKNVNKISMPLYDCFPLNTDQDNQIKCDWTQVEDLDIAEVINTLNYELGKWFFFNENYSKAYEYFQQIESSKKKCFKNLEDYLYSSKCMSDVNDLNREEEFDQFEVHLKECLEKIKSGSSCDLSLIEKTLDMDLLSQELNKCYKSCQSLQERKNIRNFTFYLISKLPCLKEYVNDIINITSNHVINENGNINESSDMIVEEGEIDAEEEPDKDYEILLLECTTPEMIQDLISKVNKHPLLINRHWDIPRAHALCLKNSPPNQYNKCHIVLAKAAELRRAKMFTESRILYLSLLEDFQASLPNLADIITYELLQTDLKHHIEINDIDERRICDLLAKCERILKNEKVLSDLSPELIDLCCLFLLENHSHVLKELVNSKNPFLRLASLLAFINVPEVNTQIQRSKEFWALILTAFSNNLNNKANRNASVSKRSHMIYNLNLSSFRKFLKKLKNPLHISIIISCLIKIYNIQRDNCNFELSQLPLSPNIQWPSTLQPHSGNISLVKVTEILKMLLQKGLTIKPNEINLIRCNAELALIECKYAEAIKNYLLILIITTEYFSNFGTHPEEESIIQRLIHCSTKLGCHTQAAVLHQMTKDVNYSLAFKGLSEKCCNDSCDDLYECFWDITILEFLVNLHTKRSEVDRKQKVIQIIGQLELNANNSEEIIFGAANVRKKKFFRSISKKYMYMC